MDNDKPTSAVWPLAVHLVMQHYDPVTNDLVTDSRSMSSQFADSLFKRLSSDERAPKIPVRLWYMQGSGEDKKIPKKLPLQLAEKNLVIVIVDQDFFEDRQKWRGYINSVAQSINKRNGILIPISVDADASRVSAEFANINHISVKDSKSFAYDERIFQAIFTALVRLLRKDIPPVFLCHAKRYAEGNEDIGGEAIAKRIRRYIYEDTQLSCFFDLHDIPHGDQVKEAIQDAIKGSIVLAIWTDELLDSPWCQFELIETRRGQRPMLVLEAMTSKNPRIFPFLSNMPVVCWNSDECSEVVSGLLLELLRTSHLEAVFKAQPSFEKLSPSFRLYPPDILDITTALNNKEQKKCDSNIDVFVYPDPPIKSNELAVLQGLFPKKRFLSLIEWRALRATNDLDSLSQSQDSPRPDPLKDMEIGMSLSSSDTWDEMGLTAQHQDDLASDIALQLILLGSKLIWGGDLRPDGFGMDLQNIVRTYQQPSQASQAHVGLCFPYSPDPKKALSNEALMARRRYADVKVAQCPIDSSKYPLPSDFDSPASKAIVALGLSLMRVDMAKSCGARIILGGGMEKFSGLYPGIAEEAYETVKKGLPLYILGGFGGAATAVFQTISKTGDGKSRLLGASLTGGAAAEPEAKKEYKKLVTILGQPEYNFDPEMMINIFEKLGLEGLSKRNGLTLEENDRLSHSQNIHEILELVIKGLCNVKQLCD